MKHQKSPDIQIILQNYLTSGMKNFDSNPEKQNDLSKMTFANLSQATAASKRFYHRSQNTFNQIQNSLMTIEIHDQG